MMSEFKDKHKGENAYIIGSGKSLLKFTPDIIGEGIIITINRAIEIINKFDFPNAIYAMCKDGPGPPWSGNVKCDIPCDKCPQYTAPKNGTILVHKHESLNCFKDKKRIIFDNIELGLEIFDFSAMSAIRIVQEMGCEKLYMVSFDSITIMDWTGIDGKIGNYHEQEKRLKPLLGKMDRVWITPK